MQLGSRLLHVLKRLLPISIYLLQVYSILYLIKFSIFNSQVAFLLIVIVDIIIVNFCQKDGEYLSGHEVFLRRVASAFNNFAESTQRSCLEKYTPSHVATFLFLIVDIL